MDIVVLAAGKGTRMKSPHPKALVPLLGVPMLHIVLKRVLELFESSSRGRITVVVGHRKEEIVSSLENYKTLTGQHVETCVQENALGTADALKSYFQSINGSEKATHTMVLCCDTPLLETKDLRSMYELSNKEDLDAVVASFNIQEPKGYGRVLNFSKGLKIIEEKEASSEQKQITEVNSGLYIFKTELIEKFLDEVNNQNNSGEFYLTDVFQEGRKVKSLNFGETNNFLGVNDLVQLESVEKEHVLRNIRRAQHEGVRFLDSSNTYISENTVIGESSVVYPNVVMEGNNHLGVGVTVGPSSHLKNCKVGAESEILTGSVLEDCQVSRSCSIGPYARLRPNAIIGEGSKIGNFVEIKKSTLHRGVKVSHLSYVGDAEIGDDTNIGCGFITCNYDGAQKHKTTIGKGCFIGSDSQTVAPVNIGDECFVASGSTINQNMPSGSFAISRGKQVTKNGAAAR
ncbi:MAG: bifunctional UDP-N-acetylglucosamine diphosphorylase/glucosamine-1-phosphate N-acetyltransferase GlmU, partial [Bdellovibrionales bacterium]|nr:bifunctional UDP-N-acetylglucosamine diphosphorylase/glucosamine-1-phosphate N-acetyltransferase GlmU [Bdellovibrionales bacterium]